MGFPRALAEALAAKLRTAVPSFAEVYPEWPEMNQQLVYPSCAITTREPVYTRCAPYLLSIGDVVNNQATSIYCVGEFEARVQLDIWTRYKIERDTFYDRVFQVLEPASGLGLALQLSDYFDQWATVTQLSFKFDENPEAVARKEWRVFVELAVTCKAISTAQDYVITQEPVLVFDTPATIP